MSLNRFLMIQDLFHILKPNTNLSEKNYIAELTKYYEELDLDEIMNKIFVLFLLKLSEDEDISQKKYLEVKKTLQNYLCFFNDNIELKVISDIILPLKNDEDYESIDYLFDSFNNITHKDCYSFIIYKYIKIFGDKETNFSEVFQIILSYIYNRKIICNFEFPYDDDFFFKVTEYISNLNNNDTLNQNYNIISINENEQISEHNEIGRNGEKQNFNIYFNPGIISKRNIEVGYMNDINEAKKDVLIDKNKYYIEDNIKKEPIINLNIDKKINIKKEEQKKKEETDEEILTDIEYEDSDDKIDIKEEKYEGKIKDENENFETTIEKNEIIKSKDSIGEDEKDLKEKNEGDITEEKIENIINNENNTKKLDIKILQHKSKNTNKKRKKRRKTKNLERAKQNKIKEIKLKIDRNKENTSKEKINSENNDEENIINEKIERKKEDQKTMNENENLNEISIDSKKEVPINISESEDFYEINMEKSNLIDLKQGLKPKESLKEYFKRTLDYYKRKKDLEIENYYLFDLANKDYFSLTDKFVFKIDSDKSPFVSRMFQFLKEQLRPVKNTNNKTVYKEYQGPESFGYLLYQNTEYFYVFKNDYNRELFNDINRVKECELEKKSNATASRNTYKTGSQVFDKIESFVLSSENFENKISKFMKEFKLIELPNYFFSLRKKKKEESIKKLGIEIDMNDVENNYFSSFIEIDSAFAYYEFDPLTIIDENSRLFKVSKTINVSLSDEKIEISENEKNNFEINKNTIILIEDKLSFPKIIEDFARNKIMKRADLFSSLNFVIYKTIKRINIFNEYLRYISGGKKISYSYFLLLIYDTNPILNVENKILEILQNLQRNKLIKYPNFKIKVIYALPCITFNDSEKIAKLEDEIVKMKKESNEKLEENKRILASLKKENERNLKSLKEENDSMKKEILLLKKLVESLQTKK